MPTESGSSFPSGHRARIDGLDEPYALRLAEQEFRAAADHARSRLLEVTLGKPTELGLAKEIMGGELFLGAKEVGATFGVELPPDDLKTTVPFSFSQLEAAKAGGGSFLRLRVSGLTMAGMEQRIQPRWAGDGRNKGQVLYAKPEARWYGSEDFFNKDKMSSDWVLAAKDLVPGSLGLNALDQMEVLAKHVRKTVFGGLEEIPSAWAQALAEFENAKEGIRAIIVSDWQEAARRISGLQLFTLSGRLPVDGLSDAMVWRDHRGDMMPYVYERTPRRSSGENFVDIGSFDSAGAGVSYWYSNDGNGGLGVSFSPRSLL